MKEAYYYKKHDNNKVHCTLCPHECIIPDGKRGICHVRKNNSGVLYAETYEQAAALHVDPVEKKPLYHFHPHKPVLSLGSIGCNMSCRFCQNCDISQAHPEEFHYLRHLPVESVIEQARSIPGNIGIAYTYNEPAVYYEYMLDTAKEARKNHLKNIVITNGFISPAPLEELLPYIDAFNIDLKAFNDNFYKKLTASHLDPVLQAIMAIAGRNIHLEITNLIIPGYNDNSKEFESMIRWINEQCGADTPLHLSRYFPAYRLQAPATPVETLKKFRKIAQKYLTNVYLGNVRL